MQHVNKRWQRVISGFMAIVMTLALLPGSVFPVKAAGVANYDIAADIDAGKTIGLNISPATTRYLFGWPVNSIISAQRQSVLNCL